MTDADAKKIWKEFRAFTDYVDAYLSLFDHTMRGPECVERGQELARLANELNLKNDMVRRFTLGLDFNGRPLRQGPPARRALRSREKHPG